jgi:hypothetical protein
MPRCPICSRIGRGSLVSKLGSEGGTMLQLMLAAWAGLAFVYFIWPGIHAFI